MSKNVQGSGNCSPQLLLLLWPDNLLSSHEKIAIPSSISPAKSHQNPGGKRKYLPLNKLQTKIFWNSNQESKTQNCISTNFPTWNLEPLIRKLAHRQDVCLFSLMQANFSSFPRSS